MFGTTTSPIKPRPADERFGYSFGVDGLCSVSEAMSFLSVGRSTIYRRFDDGRLRRGRIGNRTKICRRSVLEYANSIEK